MAPSQIRTLASAMNTGLYEIDAEELADLEGELGVEPGPHLSSREDVLREVKLRVLEVLRDERFEPPRLPAVATDVLRLAHDPEVPLARLAALIQRDQFLAGATLRTANAAFFAPAEGRRITSLREAVARLGLRRTRDIVVGAAVRQTVYRGARRVLLEDLWRAALGTAVSSSLIAQAVDKAPDQTFLLGLLHDVGMPVLADILDGVLASAPGRFDFDTVAAEVFHLLHARAGARIVSLWQLPGAYAEAISCHHDRRPPPALRRTTAMIRLSDLVYELSREEGEQLHHCERLLHHPLVAVVGIPEDRFVQVLALYPGVLAAFLDGV